MILQTLATTYNYVTTTEYTTPEVDTGVSMIVVGIAVVFAVIMIAALWKIFAKAGRPGWAAIVPIYNTLQIIWTSGKPWWWLLLLCIPVVNIVLAVVLYYNLAKAFGKGVGYTILLLLLPIIGFPMLAWGSATYKLKKPARV